MTSSKKLIVFGAVMFAATFLFAFMPTMGIKTICHIKPGWFGFLSLGIVLFSGGFFNLIGYRKNINRAPNLMMMVIWFFTGSLIIVTSIWRILGELNR
jgi:hypothetical protein